MDSYHVTYIDQDTNLKSLPIKEIYADLKKKLDIFKYFNAMIDILFESESIVDLDEHDEEKFSKMIPNFSSRLTVKPGITGFAQAFGYKGYVGSRVDIANRYRLDKKYSQTYSFWLDMKLIFFTIKTVINSK